MYLMFKYKNMRPSEFWDIPYGERRIMAYFIKRELHERAEEMKALYGGGG